MDVRKAFSNYRFPLDSNDKLIEQLQIEEEESKQSPKKDLFIEEEIRGEGAAEVVGEPRVDSNKFPEDSASI